ncbi:MAG: CHAT domain-containing protein [Armatimonadetes bacterium]|nr:CHAT domain-containing protein [Armatimonadota bacterium]
MATTLDNLGVAAACQGDATAAEDFHRHALAIRERLAPESLAVASSLNNLGAVALGRGDLDAAELDHRHALAIRERLAPGSLDLAASLHNLGLLARNRGDLAAAEDLYRRALAIKDRLAPDSLEVTSTLNNLGVIACNRGDWAAAEGYHQRALAIQDRLSPGSLDVASSLGNLGRVAHGRGEIAAAESYHRRALAIKERLAPGSLDLALSLNNLGYVALEDKRPADARRLFERSVRILEGQRRQIGSANGRSLLNEQHEEKSNGLFEACLALGDVPGAYGATERFRGRGLVEALAERGTDLSDAPPELLRRRDDLDNQRRIAYTSLGRCQPGADDARIEPLRAEIARLAVEQREFAAELHRASPKYAALAYPEPLDLKAVQATLDPGTLLLTYVVHAQETFLFAISRASCKLHRIPLEADELRQKVTAHRTRAAGNRLRGEDPAPASAEPPAGTGQALYDLLLRPAKADINASQRLLICPDDVLHTLPFATLATRQPGAAEHYLMEDRSSHTIVSMGVYVEARKARNDAADRKPWLGFGDPLYGPGQTAQRGDDSYVRRGGGLGRLPGTRTEVEGIASLLGAGAVSRLDKDATETAARTATGTSRILHFACHGLLDNVDPFGSALALTADQDNDGLLRAYEILEHVRLKADLVVLSACETGLGEQTRFEGVVGLTRAFIYAGTPSVVVSLWSVPDESTTKLMTEFYRQLQAGKPKDEALRQAQLVLLHDKDHPEWARPFYWAAFELVGDWR